MKNPNNSERAFLARIRRLGGRSRPLNKRQTRAALAIHRRDPGCRANEILVILQLRGL